MKKPKEVKRFSFKDISNKEMVDLVNSSLPVNLKYNEDLVNRVNARYAVIDKTKVAIIIKAVFQSLRDLLILGKVLNFNKLFFDTKLLVFQYTRNGITVPAVKVKVSTPPPLRKIIDEKMHDI